MDARRSSDASGKNRTKLERKSDRELVVTRTFNAPARIMFEAWSNPEIFQRWWVPKSLGLNLVGCKMDVRVGGRYCLTFKHNDGTMDFFGTYREVTPYTRLSWTNDEGEGPGAITTVTFEETNGKTLLTVHDLYPTKEALEEALASGAPNGLPEKLDQLDELLTQGS